MAVPENSIAEEEIEGLPSLDGTGLGEPPPGEGAEAFTDEALDSLPDEIDDAEEVPANAAQPEASGTEQPEGIEHDPRFKNLRRLQNQQAEELKATRMRAAQMEQALQQVAPLLNQNQAQQTEFDPFDPESVARFIEQQVHERTQQQAQVFTRQQSAAQMRQEIDQTVSAFRQENPDVAEGSELDQRVAAVMLDIQTPDDGDRPDVNLYPVTLDNLRIAKQLALEPTLYQAVVDLDLLPDEETVQIARDALANPALYEEFKAQPELLDSEHGIRAAYRRAGMAAQIKSLPGQVQEAAARGVKSAMPARMRQQAYVETGGTGAPASSAPGQRAGDDFDEVVDVYRKSSSGSVF